MHPWGRIFQGTQSSEDGEMQTLVLISLVVDYLTHHLRVDKFSLASQGKRDAPQEKIS